MFCPRRNKNIRRCGNLDECDLLCTWCSSAKRENFNPFTLCVCFNYVTQIARISPHRSLIPQESHPLENPRSNTNSIMTNT